MIEGVSWWLMLCRCAMSGRWSRTSLRKRDAASRESRKRSAVISGRRRRAHRLQVDVWSEIRGVRARAIAGILHREVDDVVAGRLQQVSREE